MENMGDAIWKLKSKLLLTTDCISSGSDNKMAKITMHTIIIPTHNFQPELFFLGSPVYTSSRLNSG